MSSSLAIGKYDTPVKVYCRVKPHHTAHGERCVTCLDSTTIELSPPSNENEMTNHKEKPTLLATFTRVFPSSDDQDVVFKDVGMPLIRKFVGGENGLLFAYGVTGSGKTHTLSGTPASPGIIPRTIAYIFNCIGHQMTPDDGMYIDYDGSVSNELRGMRRNSFVKKPPFPTKPESIKQWKSIQVDIEDNHKILESHYRYAVYISFVEVYNGKIYDLLSSTSKSFDRKQLRVIRDYSSPKNLFTECERQFDNIDDAFSAYLHGEQAIAGQQFRKCEKTNLNSTSSRGHTIFTIRLVQIKGFSLTEIDNESYVISQLSICDLAGSERARRTNNEGERFKEGNTINASLSVLQNCIRIMRDNQNLKKISPTNVSLKIVPYRENTLTHIFRFFFEGQGTILMLVCLSPRADEYDENTHIIKFSEVVKEVIPTNTLKKTPKKKAAKSKDLNYGATPTPQKRVKFAPNLCNTIEIPPCPPFKLSGPGDSETLPNYACFIKKCVELSNPISLSLIETLNTLKEEIQRDYAKLNQLEKGNMNDYAHINILKANLEASQNQCELYKKKIEDYESDIRALQTDLLKFKNDCSILSAENKRLREDAQKMETEISKRYDALYREKLSKYAVNMVGNIKKINQIRDIAAADNNETPNNLR